MIIVNQYCMGFSSWYENYKKNSMAWRAKYFAPILKLLAALKITPDQITLSRLLFIVPIAYGFYLGDLLIVLIFYVLFWLADLVDGALARYLNISHDRGRFLDTMVDNLMYALALVGFIYLNVTWSWLLALNIVLEAAVQIVGIIKKQPQFKSDWLLKAQADQPYFKSVGHLLLILYFCGYNVLGPGFGLLNLWLGITFLKNFLTLK